ncbi:hypothetical protein Naga_101441g3 [Nannochloropsis gaditana]|uniref:Uncharacterized protein n=1 Tax=Nannochloropsis gaditana TaxID=72520 RepID=W7T9I0_9STRA|nr:hypothetical protein Naga_101441g3 [Nannochloropsis gaditana]
MRSKQPAPSVYQQYVLAPHALQKHPQISCRGVPNATSTASQQTHRNIAIIVLKPVVLTVAALDIQLNKL